MSHKRPHLLLAIPLALGVLAFTWSLSGTATLPEERALDGSQAVGADAAAPYSPAPAPQPATASASAPRAAGTAADPPGTAGKAPLPATGQEAPEAPPAPTAPVVTGHQAPPPPAPSGPDLRPVRRAGQVPVLFIPDPIGDPRVPGPFRPDVEGRDQSHDPSGPHSEEERRQLVAEGRDLFFSTTAFGQRPSQGNHVAGEFLSCATCHSGPGFTDGRTHMVGPVRHREIAPRHTPHLFGLEGTAPYGWDGRNPTLQDQARGAIVSPLEMHAAREPTKRELDAITEFMIAEIKPPPAIPGVDFDPVLARLGEKLFFDEREVIDPSGEFSPNVKLSCATCHPAPFFTDNKPHRIGLPGVPFGDPAVDPGVVDEDGRILGFLTPALIGVRLTAPYFHDGLAGDPTSPNNLLGGGLGVSVLELDPGASGTAAARRALRDNLLPFYNNVRFDFGFTQAELDALTEFLLSL